MFKLDNAFLEQLGLGSLPPAEKNKMLAHIYETLEMRVGMKLAEQMSNEQLDEFESYINRQDEAGALKWLESNFPDYKQVVAQELEKLKSEISQVAPQIVVQSQQNQAQNQSLPATQQPSPPPQQYAPAPQQQQPPAHNDSYQPQQTPPATQFNHSDPQSPQQPQGSEQSQNPQPPQTPQQPWQPHQ